MDVRIYHSLSQFNKNLCLFEFDAAFLPVFGSILQEQSEQRIGALACLFIPTTERNDDA
jgi:hypothetical protein